MMGGKPAYDLQHLQQLVGQGELSRGITTAARKGAEQAGFVPADIVAAVLELTVTEFYKSMEAEKCPGMWQDVYHLEYRGVTLYLKLQLSPDHLAVVVQFKRK